MRLAVPWSPRGIGLSRVRGEKGFGGKRYLLQEAGCEGLPGLWKDFGLYPERSGSYLGGLDIRSEASEKDDSSSVLSKVVATGHRCPFKFKLASFTFKMHLLSHPARL